MIYDVGVIKTLAKLKVEKTFNAKLALKNYEEKVANVAEKTEIFGNSYLQLLNHIRYRNLQAFLVNFRTTLQKAALQQNLPKFTSTLQEQRTL